MNETENLKEPSQFSELVKLAIPLAIVQLAFQFLGFVDTAVAGRIDEISLAAAGLGSSLFFGVAMVGLGIVLGTDPVASQAMGADRPRLARQALWQGGYLAALVCIPVSLLLVLIVENLEVLGVPGQLASLTADYTYARLPSLLPYLISVPIACYLQARKAAIPIVAGIFVSNLFNFIADWVLAFGDSGLETVGLGPMGLPAYGVVGIAWASTVAMICQVAIMIWAVSKMSVGEGDEPIRRLQPQMLLRIGKLGLPIGMELFAEIGLIATIHVLMGQFGVLAVAANQIAITIASASYAVCLGIGESVSIHVGLAIGKSDIKGTRTAGLSGIAFTVAVMLIPSLLMLLIPEVFARILTNEQTVIDYTVGFLGVAALFQLAYGTQAVAAGALRGAGMTKWSFRAAIVSFWGVALPLGAVLAFWLDMGPIGLWWGLTVGLIVLATVLSLKFSAVSRERIERI